MGRYNFNQKTQDGYEISPEQAKKWLEKRENRVKRGTQYAKFAFYRTANRLNQYYKTATGQRVAKRVNDGDFPYNVYDASGGIVKPETKKAKKVV